MAIRIDVFVNSDDAFVAWRTSEPIKDCIGFELRRQRNGKLEVARNRVSFSTGEPDPGQPESSTLSPLRRYTWTDHEMNSGDKVAYQVAPVIQSGNAEPTVDDASASPFSIHDPDVAKIFLDQWGRLRDAGNSTPKDLVDANSEVKSKKKVGSSRADVWFTRSSEAQEMDAMNTLIENARGGSPSSCSSREGHRSWMLSLPGRPQTPSCS